MPVNLKGKTYYTVSERITAFREVHPIADGWAILTEILHVDDKVVRMRARIEAPGNDGAARCIVATGTAEETRTKGRGVNATSALENCETSAIGRALAAAGFGGGGEYASADELTRALEQRDRPQQDNRGHDNKPQQNNRGQPAATDADRREFAQNLKDKLNLPAADVMRWLVFMKTNRPVTVDQHSSLFSWLRDEVGEDCRDWIQGNPAQ